MIERAPFILSLLNIPLLAGMIVFIVVRRPRQLITWLFVGVMAGLVVYYLADVVQYRPDLSVLTGLIWQFVSIQGANLTILAALALNILLRDKRLNWWEWAITGFIVVRMVVDSIWLAGLLRPDLPRSCQIPQGLPKLTCSPEDRLAIATGALVALMVAVLYVSTTFKAAEPKRSILRRYVVWIVLLIVAGSLSLHALSLVGRFEFGIAPSGPLVLLAALVGLRLFLALEEEETGVQLSVVSRGILIWLAALIVAVVVDVNWTWLGAPVWTFIVLAVGLAGGSAYLVTLLAQRARAPDSEENQERAGVPAPAATAPDLERSGSITAPAAPLQIYLLGPMRVVRNGETLPNSTEIWRSAKARSLLAYLALRSPRGATQVEIVDALWPLSENLSREGLSKAEQQSQSAFRSYLSTLRRVLEPDGSRGSDRYVEVNDKRYRLRPESGIWVDVWVFEALAALADKHWAAGRPAEAVACWEQALTLYPAEGLLPDEEHLLPEFIEPRRERLRQVWLAGVHRLAAHFAEHGPIERATELRQLMREIGRTGEED